MRAAQDAHVMPEIFSSIVDAALDVEAVLAVDVALAGDGDGDDGVGVGIVEHAPLGVVYALLTWCLVRSFVRSAMRVRRCSLPHQQRR